MPFGIVIVKYAFLKILRNKTSKKTAALAGCLRSAVLSELLTGLLMCMGNEGWPVWADPADKQL